MERSRYSEDKAMDEEELRTAYRALYVKYCLQGVEMVTPQDLPIFQPSPEEIPVPRARRWRTPSLENQRLREQLRCDQHLALRVVTAAESLIRLRWSSSRCLNCGSTCVGGSFCRLCYQGVHAVVKKTIKNLVWELRMKRTSSTFVGDKTVKITL